MNISRHFKGQIREVVQKCAILEALNLPRVGDVVKMRGRTKKEVQKVCDDVPPIREPHSSQRLVTPPKTTHYNVRLRMDVLPVA